MRIEVFQCVHCLKQLNEAVDERCSDHPDGARTKTELVIVPEDE